MTYADSSADDRIPKYGQAVREIEAFVHKQSPFLGQWFADINIEDLESLDRGSGFGIFSVFWLVRAPR